MESVLLEFGSASLVTIAGEAFECKLASPFSLLGANSSLWRLTGVGRILLLGVTELAVSGDVVEACFKAGKSDTSSLYCDGTGGGGGENN